MARPTSVSAASWIWMFTALFTTFTVANILTATEILVVFADLNASMDDLPPGEAFSWFGWMLAIAAMVAMAVQVVAAVKLRDGAVWARLVLSVFAFFSLLGVLADFTMVSAWLLLAANVVALVLAYGQSASEFLEQRHNTLVSA